MAGRIVHTAHHVIHVGSRRRPTSRPQFHFGQYIDKLFGIDGKPLVQIPPAPLAGSYTTKALAALRRNYKNNLYGCCVPAGLLHLKGIWTGNAGIAPGGQQFTDDEALAFYRTLSGGVFDPADPSTDNGCDEMTALNLAKSQGFPDGSKILGYMRVDASNWAHVTMAMWLFEGLLTGSELPDTWIANLPSDGNFTFDVAGPANPNNGHCMSVGAWDSDGADLYTWGMIGRITKAAFAKYMVPAAGGELYALLSQDVIDRATMKAANGFDFNALQEDMQSIQAA